MPYQRSFEAIRVACARFITEIRPSLNLSMSLHLTIPWSVWDSIWSLYHMYMSDCQIRFVKIRHLALKLGGFFTQLLIPTHAHFHWLKFIKNI